MLRIISVVRSGHITDCVVTYHKVQSPPDDNTRQTKESYSANRVETDEYPYVRAFLRDWPNSRIELQPRYGLMVNSHKLGFYRADFRYEVIATGVQVVEDVKSKALYGIEIVEV